MNRNGTRPCYTPVGMWCWLLHRISGVVLVLFAAINSGMIVLLSMGEQRFDLVMRLMRSPLVLVMELLMLPAVLFHLFNGVRLLMIHAGLWVEDQKDMAYTVFVVVVIAYLLHSLPIIEQFAGAVLFK